MPDFRYFELFNNSEEAGHTIFPWLNDSDDSLVFDGSRQDIKINGVGTGGKSCLLCTGRLCLTGEPGSHAFDFNRLPGPKSGTIVMLGCCQENASKTEQDTADKWTYNLKSGDTAIGRYYGKGKFMVEHPKPSTANVEQPNPSTANPAALPDTYYSIYSPAAAKLLVALAGFISPQMI